MAHWTAEQLETIDAVGEIRVAAYRADSTLRELRIIWHVVVAGKLYIRSVRGVEGAWYRGVERTHAGVIEVNRIEYPVDFAADSSHDDAVDAAYRAKYGNGSAVRAITSPQARATTLSVTPR